jgi:hypothetical protein
MPTGPTPVFEPTFKDSRHDSTYERASSTTLPVPEPGRDLLADRIPTLITNGNSTISESIHTEVEFIGKLEHWENLEKEVADLYQTHFKPNENNKHNLGQKPKDNKPGLNNTHNEVSWVGDEHSLQGKFTHRVLDPVTTAVLDKLPTTDKKWDWEYVVRYGDSKTSNCKNGTSKLPDFVASKMMTTYVKDKNNNNNNKTDIIPLVLGEAKVFWTHTLEKWYQEISDDNPGRKFRQLLGKTNPALSIVFFKILTQQVRPNYRVHAIKHADIFFPHHLRRNHIPEAGKGRGWTLLSILLECDQA